MFEEAGYTIARGYNDYKAKAAAAGKRISDADLAKMISASDLPKDLWWTWSSTQEDLVKDMLKDYPNR